MNDTSLDTLGGAHMRRLKVSPTGRPSGSFEKSKGFRQVDLALVVCPGWGVIQPPVGISYLKGFLSRAGINLKCFDLNLELYKGAPDKSYWDSNCPEYFVTPQLFTEHILPFLKPFFTKWAVDILKYSPEVVGFSLFMTNANASLMLARCLKEINPHLIIIAGGPEAMRIKRVYRDGIKAIASINQEIFTDDVFDILVYGEGEEALLDILSALKQGLSLEGIKGILYKRQGKFITNAAREWIKDLDILAYPDYHDFELRNYALSSLPITTSRGCINRCTFCAESLLWQKYRVCSAERVIKEITFLMREYGINEFQMSDSTFNGDINRVDKICDLIINSGLNILWSGKANLLDSMDYALLVKMKRAGCDSLAYGLESGSPGVLEDMRKNINLKTAERIIRDTHRAGIHANCFFIIGYPTETEEDFQMTLDFVRKNAEHIHIFDHVTGCHIEEDSYLGLNAEKYGIVFKDDGWHSRESTPVIRKERLERFKELARYAHKHYQCQVQT